MAFSNEGPTNNHVYGGVKCYFLLAIFTALKRVLFLSNTLLSRFYLKLLEKGWRPCRNDTSGVHSIEALNFIQFFPAYRRSVCGSNAQLAGNRQSPTPAGSAHGHDHLLGH
jgi:hypothetical protein